MGRPDLSNWNPFENYSYGDRRSEDDSEFQEMKDSYEKMSPKEQLEFKNDKYDGMVDDEIIKEGDMPNLQASQPVVKKK